MAAEYNCSTWTCSLYLTKSQVKWLARNVNLAVGGPTGLAVAICGYLAPAWPVGLGCIAVMLVYGFRLMDAVTEAAGRDACVRLRFSKYPEVALVGIYVDDSGYCNAS
ncbi:hypothetical protein [Nocardia sp. CDC160]|uniref:hypothetical protein n=1 Tax=Nocardia sp. CDC160 TaxID=3112166 RepID=UPI002DB6681C|nr:hypothetical protein [Nocardia sp. CDC160]MEC3920302.1 hypothetical protein [Nocardia sp. CDC160]